MQRKCERTVKTEGQSGSEDPSKSTSMSIMTPVETRLVKTPIISQSHQSAKRVVILEDVSCLSDFNKGRDGSSFPASA